MPKRSQISLFLIIGAVLLVMGLFVFFVIKNQQNSKILQAPESSSQESLERQAFADYVESCIQKVSEPLIFDIALSGGSFTPKMPVLFNGDYINALSAYKSYEGYNNNLLLETNMEDELNSKIKVYLKECINLTVFINQGYKINNVDMSINSTIAPQDISVSLSYPIKLERANRVMNFDKFLVNVRLPLGSLFLAAADIINSEAETGFFDKEDYMLRSGGQIKIEKLRPYPDEVYILRYFSDKHNKDLVFRFALKGKDTAGSEVIRYNQNGCCKIKNSNTCIKNVDSSSCLYPNSYNSSFGCSCPKNYHSQAYGCCDNADYCKLTTQSECMQINGKFYENDLMCSKSKCTNLECKKTYSYTKNDFSGPKRKHGESWCSYESIVGKGVDYVGTRHYLHSCINGVEYVEPCRDFREELCSEENTGQPDNLYAKGLCRINRWYDCSEQNSKSDCENNTLRDCAWADWLFSARKCFPLVTPGLKFWEPSYNKICNVASEDKGAIGKKFPKSWGHGVLLYCQRTGDCGNYRNIADDITTMGYYNRDGIPEPWVYRQDGLITQGDNFVIRADIDKYQIADNAVIPTGTLGKYASCGLWQPPTANKCQLCNSSNLHPCTEYRCRSLGKDCAFSKNTSSCTASSKAMGSNFTVLLTSLKEGFLYELKNNEYYHAQEYEISPSIRVHKPFAFQFSTTEPTRCRLSIIPPTIHTSAGDSPGQVLPDVLLNEQDYNTTYNVELRFPSSSFTNMNKYLIFIKCNDKEGNAPESDKFLSVTTIENDSGVIAPEILKIEYSYETENARGNFKLYVSEPFESCKFSLADSDYAHMNNLSCATEEKDILYTGYAPLGSYLCDASASINHENPIIFACQDKNKNLGTKRAY